MYVPAPDPVGEIVNSATLKRVLNKFVTRRCDRGRRSSQPAKRFSTCNDGLTPGSHRKGTRPKVEASYKPVCAVSAREMSVA